MARPAVAPAEAAAKRACRDTQLLPNAGNLAKVRGATLCLVNAVRTKRGLRRLRFSARLRGVATQRSQDMVRRQYFSHPTAPGAGLSSDLLHLGRRGPPMTGENIAWGMGGFSTARSVVAGWLSSTTHLRNMLTKRFRVAGVGIAIGAPRDLVSTQVAATYTLALAAR